MNLRVGDELLCITDIYIIIYFFDPNNQNNNRWYSLNKESSYPLCLFSLNKNSFYYLWDFFYTPQELRKMKLNKLKQC